MAKMNKQTALMIGGGILLLGVGFFIYKRIRAKKKYSMPDLSPPIGGGGGHSTTSSSSSESSSSSSFDPTTSARAIHDSMKGWGTDEDLFFNTARSLSQAQRDKVKEYFDTNYGDLKDWIEGDFSGQDERDALSLFNL